MINNNLSRSFYKGPPNAIFIIHKYKGVIPDESRQLVGCERDGARARVRVPAAGLRRGRRREGRRGRAAARRGGGGRDGAPTNGAAGDCTNSLASGSECQPTCVNFLIVIYYVII